MYPLIGCICQLFSGFMFFIRFLKGETIWMKRRRNYRVSARELASILQNLDIKVKAMFYFGALEWAGELWRTLLYRDISL